MTEEEQHQQPSS